MKENDAALLARLHDRRVAMEKTLRRVRWFRLAYPLVATIALWLAMALKSALLFAGLAAVCGEYMILIPRLRRRAAKEVEDFAQRTIDRQGGGENPDAAMRLEMLQRSHNLQGICLAGAGMAAASLLGGYFYSHASRSSLSSLGLGMLLGVVVSGAIALNCGRSWRCWAHG